MIDFSKVDVAIVAAFDIEMRKIAEQTPWARKFLVIRYDDGPNKEGLFEVTDNLHRGYGETLVEAVRKFAVIVQQQQENKGAE